MRLPSRRWRAPALIAGGTLGFLAIIILLLVWRDSWDDSRLPGESRAEPLVLDTPSALPTAAPTGDGPEEATGDGTLHRVVLTFTADGPLKAAWKFRAENGDIEQRAQSGTGRIVVDQTMQGPLPTAIGWVQMINGSSYARCTITVDGENISTRTTYQLYGVEMCI